MQGDNHPLLAALREERERTIAHLTDAFAADELSLEGYEQRLDRAYSCTTVGDLKTLTADLTQRPLQGGGTAQIVPVQRTQVVVVDGASSSTRTALVPVSTRPGSPTTRAILSSIERAEIGPLKVRSLLAVMGNVELDLRDVTLPPGVTTLRVRAVLGNIEITVPPDLCIDCDGDSVLGNFSNTHRVPQDGTEGQSILRIVGRSVLGSVEVRTQPRALPAK